MKPLLRTIPALFLAALALLSAEASRAQEDCMSHDEAVTWLKQEFGERVTGRGLTDDGRSMMEVFVSEEGTWTLLVSFAPNISCVIASGRDWQQIPNSAGNAGEASADRVTWTTAARS